MKNKLSVVFSKQYNKLPIETKASLWFVVCNFVQKAISLITLPIFTRLMTTEQYGLVTLYSSWESILSIFVTLNLGAGVYVTAYVKYEQDKERMTAAFIGLGTFVTLIWGGIYWIFKEQCNAVLGMPTVVVILMLVQMLVTPAYTIWSMEQKFENRYKQLIVVTLLIAILTPVLGVIAVLCFEQRAIAKIASSVLVQFLVCGTLYIKLIFRGKKFYSAQYWKYALSFAIPLIPHYLSLSILNQSDRIMIANFCGQGKAAIYGVAYSLATVVSLIFSSINSSFGPWSVKQIKQGEYDGICKRIRGIMPGVAVIILVLLCFEPEIILIFASEKYYEAIWVMPPITVGLFFTFINSIFLRVEFYYEMKHLIAISSCVAAFLNVILNYLFIPRYGYMAAGYTTMICYMCLCVSHYFAMRYVANRFLGGRNLFEMKYMMGMACIVCATAMLMLLLYNHTIARYTLLGLTMVVIVIKRKTFIEKIRENY